jgi:hypothetical protein
VDRLTETEALRDNLRNSSAMLIVQQILFL